MLSNSDQGDIKHYYGYAKLTLDGQVPYRDFTLEYPPGFLPVLLAPAPADQGYYDRFRVLMLVFGAAAVVSSLSPCFSREPPRPSSPPGYSCSRPCR
jgi:hypothetical protein